MTTVDVDPPSKQQLLKTTGIAAAIAVAALFIAILPAEYGIDPLGTGKLLGLNDAGDASVDAHHVAVDPINEYSTQVVLGPNSGWIEFDLKMWLDEGESMLYQWSSSADITYDFHNDVIGTYEDGSGIGDGTEGFLTAPVSGFHGFAIKNDNDQQVTFTLRYVGEFNVEEDLS